MKGDLNDCSVVAEIYCHLALAIIDLPLSFDKRGSSMRREYDDGSGVPLPTGGLYCRLQRPRIAEEPDVSTVALVCLGVTRQEAWQRNLK